MRTSRAVAAYLIPLLFVACSEEVPPPVATPSSAFPGATGPDASGPSGPSGVLPTTSPGAATGNLSQGELSFELSGDVAVSKRLTNLISAVYTPPPGGLAVVWTAGGTDATTVGIGGASFVGTQPTSPSLSLSITVMRGTEILSFVSTVGECEVTILVASRTRLSGRFTCTRLVGGAGHSVGASGAFDAAE